MITFEGQIVLVTGAGRGLGGAHARLLAARGATVIVSDAGVERDGSGGDPGPADDVVASIVAAGGRAEADAQNLGTQDGCEQLVDRVLDRHGRIDALVHSAGIVRYQGIVDTSEQEWQRMLDINVGAAWWLCRTAWPSMASRGYGRIVLTTSGFALRVVPGADVTGYSVGKAAQFGLMNALAAEGAPCGINVNAISPVAATRIFRRQVADGEMSAESVSPAVAYLASRECRLSGQVVVAQGGEFALDTMHRSDIEELGQIPEPEDLLTFVEANAN